MLANIIEQSASPRSVLSAVVGELDPNTSLEMFGVLSDGSSSLELCSAAVVVHVPRARNNSGSASKRVSVHCML